MKIKQLYAGILFILMVPLITGDYTVNIGLVSWANPFGQLESGICCDDIFAKRCNCLLCPPTSNCDTEFKICVNSKNQGDCEQPWMMTGVIANNKNSFFLEQNHQYDSFHNPQTVAPFKGNYTELFLKVLVFDDDPIGNQTIDNIVYHVNATEFHLGITHNVTYKHSRPNNDQDTILQFYFTVQDCGDCASRTTTSTTKGTTSPHSGPTTPIITTIPTTTTYIVDTTTPSTTHSTTPSTTTTTTPSTTTVIPAADCYEVQHVQGRTQNGVYPIFPGGVDSGNSIEVYCDLTTDGGGWTVFQKRHDGSGTDFTTQTWDSYSSGFGDANTNYWLGLKYIHQLTAKDASVTLRIDLTDCTNTKWSETYSSFMINNASAFYQLNVNSGQGEATDAFNQPGNNNENSMKFSTIDKDHDLFPPGKCAKLFKGGWWFNRCGLANLNGHYYKGCVYTSDFENGIYWGTNKKWPSGYSLKISEMKLRKN